LLDLPQLQLDELSNRFTEQEVLGVIRALPPDKVPRLDGFANRFFQVAWSIIRPNIMWAFDALWHMDLHSFHAVNEALTKLLPKFDALATIKDYRPISLIHSLGKLMSKALANRLAPRLHKMVHPNQSAFIKPTSYKTTFGLCKVLPKCCMLIKRGFKRNYTIWTKHDETDDTLIEVDIGVGNNNCHGQDDGVFDGDDHDIANDDDFDFQELLCHVEPHVSSSMGTQRGLDNMGILDKSSNELLYDGLNGCGKEFTQLHVMLELLKLKASHGWSDNNFSKLLSLLTKLLPKPNTLPTCTYRV
jgi:hypothetical protein